MSLQKHEMETAINWDESTKQALLYSCSKSIMNKLDKYVEKFPDTYSVKRVIMSEGICIGKEYILPKKLISIRTPSTRVMSEENKQAASERFKKMHSKE